MEGVGNSAGERGENEAAADGRQASQNLTPALAVPTESGARRPANTALTLPPLPPEPEAPPAAPDGRGSPRHAQATDPSHARAP